MKKTFLFLIACFSLFSCVEKERTTDESPKDLVNISIIHGYTHAKVNPKERSLLAYLLPKNEHGAFRSLILLTHNDRVAAVWWGERENAEKLFEEFTEKLFQLLSVNATDIVDTDIRLDGHAPIALLAFTDPTLHSERIFFARIGDTLYEFHGNGEEEILGLLMQLSNGSVSP